MVDSGGKGLFFLIEGMVRWVNDIWDLVTGGAPDGKPDPKAERHLRRRTHQMIKQVSDSVESFSVLF